MRVARPAPPELRNPKTSEAVIENKKQQLVYYKYKTASTSSRPAAVERCDVTGEPPGFACLSAAWAARGSSFTARPRRHGFETSLAYGPFLAARFENCTGSRRPVITHITAPAEGRWRCSGKGGVVVRMGDEALDRVGDNFAGFEHS